MVAAYDEWDVGPEPQRGRQGPVPLGVTINELKRAWNAIGRGDFKASDTGAPLALNTNAQRRSVASRHRIATHNEQSRGGSHWLPAARERVLPVFGCHGFAGTTTLAVAMAEAAAGPARVVECASAAASGLSAASSAELGVTAGGLWREGRRGDVTLLRAVGPIVSATETPPPPTREAGESMTVIDCGCHPDSLGDETWLSASMVDAVAVVLVTSTTVPGLRRLESTIELLNIDHRAVVAALGPPLRRWPRIVSSSIGPRSRDLLRSDRCVAIPIDPTFRDRGIDSSPLPGSVVRAARDVLTLANFSNFPSTATHEGIDC